ncbi:hypothetical protein GMORB2_4611 [Geosmithia morbida]|uniref:Uncharacterized protein n=1 Tax=Geosmithia morbida TaxID=1094350 RepID=A0A9P5CYS2_9HYPO|nr:uncharacterized protein GMORB2_4611 [Geosmithia morbida]KAF4119702.1 hypothetical protein GMORB2_4611 [Geosmithia morbida]
MSATEKENDRPQREMKVLVMGLPRTGSASLAEALRILGYKDVYHGVDIMDKLDDHHFFNRAADASFPCLPSYNGGPPLTHDQWEELYGPCEASTDMAGAFGALMVRAYPKAKVVLPIRDYDAWARSVDDTVLRGLWNPLISTVTWIFAPLIGSVAVVAMRKVTLGLFRASDVDGARHNLSATYERHHRELRDAVPPDNLLEYRVGEGWPRLCAFLDKPVPDVDFPWVNEAAVLKAKIKVKLMHTAIDGLKVATPWAVGAVVLGGAVFWANYIA